MKQRITNEFIINEVVQKWDQPKQTLIETARKPSKKLKKLLIKGAKTIYCFVKNLKRQKIWIKVTLFVIKDLNRRVGNSPEKSKRNYKRNWKTKEKH